MHPPPNRTQLLSLNGKWVMKRKDNQKQYIFAYMCVGRDLSSGFNVTMQLCVTLKGEAWIFNCDKVGEYRVLPMEVEELVPRVQLTNNKEITDVSISEAKEICERKLQCATKKPPASADAKVTEERASAVQEEKRSVTPSGSPSMTRPHTWEYWYEEAMGTIECMEGVFEELRELRAESAGRTALWEEWRVQHLQHLQHLQHMHTVR